MRLPWRRRPDRTTGDILRDNNGGAPWALVEGSISVSASILMADALAHCERCSSWPVVGYFKRLTEQEDGTIIAGMALLFPTALAIFLGGKMVFSAYRDYKRWWEAYQEERLQQGREEGREAERARIKRELNKRGVSLDPETEKILFGEPNDHS